MLMMLLLFARPIAAAFKEATALLFEATPALLFFKNLVLRLFLLPLSPPKIPKLVVVDEQHFWWRCAFADDDDDDGTHAQPLKHRWWWWWWRWKWWWWWCVFFPKRRIFFAVNGVPRNPPKSFSLKKKVRSSFPLLLQGSAEKVEKAASERVVILSTLLNSLKREFFLYGRRERWQKGGKNGRFAFRVCCKTLNCLRLL